MIKDVRDRFPKRLTLHIIKYRLTQVKTAQYYLMMVDISTSSSVKASSLRPSFPRVNNSTIRKVVDSFGRFVLKEVADWIHSDFSKVKHDFL